MKRYQIFISSTYTDLKAERSAVVECILKKGHIPVGMEQFVAANSTVLEYIKPVIRESDYYVLIIGGRYGSISKKRNKSFTEEEYDYAVSIGLPILVFIHSDPESLPVSKSETDPEKIRKLEEFRDKVAKNRLVSMNWKTPDALANDLGIALDRAIKDSPRPGWKRSTITEKGVGKREADKSNITWEEYITMVKDLSSIILGKARGFASAGVFRPDVIVGISNGGLNTAIFLARCCGGQHPQVLGMYYTREDQKIDFLSEDLTIPNNYILKVLSNKKIKKILLVDTIARSGAAFNNALELLAPLTKSKTIKTALLIRDSDAKVQPDYCLKTLDTKGTILPYQLLN